jgi:hypothetical protein
MAEPKRRVLVRQAQEERVDTRLPAQPAAHKRVAPPRTPLTPGEPGAQSFGLNTSAEFFKAFSEAVGEYMSTSDVVVWKAMACAMFAWQLKEWVEHDPGVNKKDLKKLLNYPSIGHMKAIANGSKHCRLQDQSKGSVVASRYQPGAFDRRAFSRDFQTPCLLIEIDDGTELDFDDELEKARNCWRDFFKRSNK